MSHGRHRRRSALHAPLSEWVRDTWTTLWNTLAGTPFARTTGITSRFHADR